MKRIPIEFVRDETLTIPAFEAGDRAFISEQGKTMSPVVTLDGVQAGYAWNCNFVVTEEAGVGR